MNGTLRRKRSKRRRTRLNLEQLEKRIVLDSTAVFSEVMYHPGEGQAVEWIELFNQLVVDMDLSEWELQGGVDYEFPDGTILPGRGYIVIAADPVAFEAETGIANALGPWTGQLNNAGEALALYNNDNRLMNSIDFSDGNGGDWPVAPDGSGASLAKSDPITASEDRENWTFSSEVGGTPGVVNFVSSDDVQLITTSILDIGEDVTAFVPIDNSLGATWHDINFDDSSWVTGTSGVGYERNTGYDSFFGLDLDAPPNGQPAMTMFEVSPSVLIRVPFQLNDDPATFDSISFSIQYDDAFVAYLNGVEIARGNITGAIDIPTTTANGSRPDGDATQFQPHNITAFANDFVQGQNILTIHGVNQAANSSDLLFTPKIEGQNIVTPEEAAALELQINEIAGADDGNFFVELKNAGDDPIDLTGMVLKATGLTGGEFVLPAITLNEDEFATFTAAQLGYSPADNEKLFLYTVNKERVIDGQIVTNTLRGLSDEYENDWLYPDAATIGTENTFSFDEDIVINEIMYHAFPDLGSPGVPATFETNELLTVDAGTMWRYNQSGAALPVGWQATIHATDNVEWFEGAGLIGFESNAGALPEPIRTSLINPATNNPYVTTYYFETEFDYTGDLNDVEQLQIQYAIDDGAIFYLNGVEVDRFNMRSGNVDSSILAEGTVGDANYTAAVTIDESLLVVGTNRLSAEVHQGSGNSSDIIFGTKVLARRQTAPGVAPDPYIEANEEWLELYNKGNDPVDLTNWSIRDGIRYDFEDGTTLNAGEYLIVARDKVTLQAKYPNVTIAGNFSGSLNNGEDRLLLRDSFKNPVDDVHYFDAGNWPKMADGGGSSLELRDPEADNSKAESWTASDESSKSQWIDYTFTGTGSEPLGCCGGFNEFLFGLLDEGEILIDDISVVEDPAGAAIQLIQNSDFENDSVGVSPANYRLIGTHTGVVVQDPVDGNNQALHLIAYGPQAHVHDHVETTFVGNRAVSNSATYEISFRAKWIAGNGELNSRLYFTRASNTAFIDVPENLGSPGADNSQLEVNIGPTYDDFGHSPIIPRSSEAVTVTVRAEDPQDVNSMTLWWRNQSGAWNSEVFTLDDELFRGTIPAQGNNSVVQFYVEGVDGNGAISTYPADGRESRALYQVVDSATDNTRNTDYFRIVLRSEDNAELFSGVNRMSNHLQGGTLIRNGTEAFYNVGVRQIGSRFIRPNSGYKIRMNSDEKYMGVHKSLRFDINGITEIAIKQMVNRAGGSSVSLYDDVSRMVSPQHSERSILLNLARYENIYLSEQFANGSSGTKFELDDITYPTGANPSPEGLKSGTAVSSQDMEFRGDSAENYRGQILIKSNRTKDDYSQIVEMSRAMSLSGQAMLDATNAVMDVDLWMRHYATQSFIGNWDTYGFSRPKNLRMYVRPSDNKVIPLFWDADLANFNENYIYNGGVTSLDEIRDIPSNLRLFWGHMYDLVDRSFNAEYVTYWANHFNDLGAGTAGMANSVNNRDDSALAAIDAAIPPVNFEFTTNGGNDFDLNSLAVTLEGDGWVNVREIRLAGSSEPLDLFWNDDDSWEVTRPLDPGANTFTFEAYDFRGNQIGTDTIVVTSTIPERPLEENLRVVEINYNPHDATPEELLIDANFDGELTEYIELQNTSDTLTLNLENVVLSEAIAFTFPTTSLAPGDTILVVRDQAAFEVRYGGGLNIAGEFTLDTKLSNNGERFRLASPENATIHDFEYDDQGDWPNRADGKGAVLEIIDTEGNYGDGNNWRSSTEYSGTPDADALGPFTDIVVNEVLSHTDLPQVDSIELLNTTGADIDIGGWYISDSTNYRKYQVSSPTIIIAGEYLVLDETFFNPTPLTPGPNDFALDAAHGDDVWVMATDAQGVITRFVDHVEFDAQANGESWGRWPNGTGDLYPMVSVTLNDDNSGPRVGPLVISEIMYDPADPDGAGPIDADDLEFVELYNPTNESVNLLNWDLDRGIDVDIDPGTNIAAGATLVVISFDPLDPANATRLANFRAHYGIGQSVQISGGYSGSLSNDGERVQMHRPDEPPLDEPGFFPALLEDEVRFSNVAPWPTDANMSGNSIHRIEATLWGNDPSSWTAAAPSPGSIGDAVNIFVNSVEVNGQFTDPADLPAKGPQPTSWADQQSDIRSIVLNFNTSFIADENDFVLTNLGVNAPQDADVVIGLTAGHLVANNNTLTLTFDANELPDGVYQLDILPSLTSAVGTPLDGNNDGTPGDAYSLVGTEANGLFKIESNWNGDSGVSVFDFTTFSYWFGTAVPEAPVYVDLSNDGGISVFDFSGFANKFGVGVTFPNAFAAVVIQRVETDRPLESNEDTGEQIVRVALDANRIEFDAVRRDQGLELNNVWNDREGGIADGLLEDVLDDIANDVFEGFRPQVALG